MKLSYTISNRTFRHFGLRVDDSGYLWSKYGVCVGSVEAI